MNNDSDTNNLFETPPGVRVIPREMLLEDPDATMMLAAGDLEESEQLLAGFDPEAAVRNTREPVSIQSGERVVSEPTRPSHLDQTVWNRGGKPRAGLRLSAAFGPGARFVYALLFMKLTLGVVGLALSSQNPRAMMVAGIFAVAAGVLLWVFWRSWLGGFPYAYRLLTSLGEDAENLIRWRFFRRNTVRIRSLYR